ncbi:MAG: sigma-54 interaction domain-containing protein [Trichloromonadaceae bacterium]
MEQPAAKSLDRELLELVFDNVENGIYIVDGQGVTVGVNQTFERMSGYSHRELVGRSLYDLVGPGNKFSGSASLIVLERKAPATATYSTASNRKLLVKGRPIFDARGEIRYVINTIWDLTVVQYQQPIDADTARDQLLQEEDIVTCSLPMTRAIDLALRVAHTSSTILLSGESGVGKSLIARLIHRTSERKEKPFLQINCGAIPEALIEAELFGYEAGSFTGADRRGKIGLFESAAGGTIFLDEISELPLHLQSKLLGVLQEKEFLRVGGRTPTRIDVRLITASNKDLGSLAAAGAFRDDLYYRLNVVPIHLPALRERRDDIPLLIRYFADRYNRKYQTYKQLAPDLIEELRQRPWRGNVRELENLVERLIVTSSSDQITGSDAALAGAPAAPASAGTLQQRLEAQERQLLGQALQQYRTTRRVAEALGISQATAARKLKALRETAPEGR